MKSIRRFSLSQTLILAIAALGAFAVPAHAQSAGGRFTLVHAVRWGQAVLPAGVYAFTVQSMSWPGGVTIRQMNGPVVAIVLPSMVSQEVPGNGGSLDLQQRGGESVVTALHLNPIGLALEFALPKLPLAAAETAGLGPIAQSQPAK